MPITTFLTDHEQNQPLHNHDLEKLIDEVRQKTGENWQVVERAFLVRRFFKRPKTEYRYEVLLEVGGFTPFQIINFYRDGIDWSINTTVPAELAMAYLMGILAGMHSSEMRLKKEA